MDTKFIKLNLTFLFLLFIANLAFAQTGYKTVVKLTDLSNEVLLHKMQNNATQLLTELNNAFFEDRNPELQHGVLTEDAQEILLALWETSPFRCSETLMIERVLTMNTTKVDRYQVRNIPIVLKDIFENKSDTLNNEDDKYQEISLTFNSSGIIENIFYSLEANRYKKLMNEGISVKDIRRRQFILEFIENFRTAYNRKDLEFLEKVYSDDALIITGKVIKRRSSDVSSDLSNAQIKYQKQTKKEYIEKLKNRIFKYNKYINIKFDEIRINQDRVYKEIYGVNLKQFWNTSNYSDVGYLFLMIDFQDEYNPIIHVRTWQPNEAKDSEEGIYGLTSFEIVR